MSETDQRCPYCDFLVPAGTPSARGMLWHFKEKHKEKLQ
jgi:hypothetical protein